MSSFPKVQNSAHAVQGTVRGNFSLPENVSTFSYTEDLPRRLVPRRPACVRLPPFSCFAHPSCLGNPLQLDPILHKPRVRRWLKCFSAKRRTTWRDIFRKR